MEDYKRQIKENVVKQVFEVSQVEKLPFYQTKAWDELDSGFSSIRDMQGQVLANFNQKKYGVPAHQMSTQALVDKIGLSAFKALEEIDKLGSSAQPEVEMVDLTKCKIQIGHDSTSYRPIDTDKEALEQQRKLIVTSLVPG